MCKILTEAEKKQLFKETRLIEKLTGKKIVLESKKDCTCCSTKKALKEGIWALGSPAHLAFARQALEEWKTKYYRIAGSDAVFNGIDSAITEIEELERLSEMQLRGK